MSVTSGASVLRANVEEVFGRLGDPDFVMQMRVNAIERYEQLPVPKYERSDMSKRNVAAFRVEASVQSGDAWRTLASAYIDTASSHPLLVLADGHVVFSRGLTPLVGQGVVFCSMREAIKTHADIVARYFGHVVKDEADKWLTLNTALWRDGAFVYVPKDIVCEEPLQLISVTTEGGSGTFVRNLVVAEPHSSVTFMDAYLADPGLADEFHVGVTEVVVRTGAAVKVGTVQDLPKQTTNVLARRANVERDGSMDWVLGELGDGYTVAEFGSDLTGDGSRSTSHAVALGTGRSHFDLTARMVHIGKFSESDTSARGVMQDRANGVYRGVTQILKGATGSNGQQAERLLMMDPRARADAIPMLLIDENDVKCGHAASVGQINEEQLFYLMSRGISEAAAKRMVVWGFIDPVLSALPIDLVRSAVENVMERKLH